MRRRARDIPVVFEIYDLLYLDGRSLTQLPLRERQARLSELDLEGDAWRVAQHHEGDGAELLAAAQASGLEGIVAKPVDSRYLPGAWTLVGAESRVEITHPDRVMYPKTGFTKADVADYFRAVSAVLLPRPPLWPKRWLNTRPISNTKTCPKTWCGLPSAPSSTRSAAPMAATRRAQAGSRPGLRAASAPNSLRPS